MAPDARPAELETSREEDGTHIAGRVIDRAGSPLPDHTVEVVSGPSIEAACLTSSRGRFRITGIQPGRKELVVRGPGAGDVWVHRWVASNDFDGRTPILASEESRLTLDVGAVGIDGLVLESWAHDEDPVLIVARLLDDAARPIAGSFDCRSGEDLVALLVAGEDGLASGRVLKPGGAGGETGWTPEPGDVQWLEESVRHGDSPSRERRYLPLEIELALTSSGQDLGTLVLPREAGLAVTLSDATSGQPIDVAWLALSARGGGRPPIETQSAGEAGGTTVLWSGRNSGDFELSVEAPGYKSAQQLGVLVVGDQPQVLELRLERNR